MFDSKCIVENSNREMQVILKISSSIVPIKLSCSFCVNNFLKTITLMTRRFFLSFLCGTYLSSGPRVELNDVNLRWLIYSCTNLTIHNGTCMGLNCFAKFIEAI